MSNLLKKEDRGFTLIEIVLVLAIAGLIMVIVFLAVSGAQRSRRDTQRKNDLSRIASLVESYASNTQGCYPGSAAAAGCGAAQTWAAFAASTYITTANLNDPSTGAAYGYGAYSATEAQGNVGYRYGTSCDGTAGRFYSLIMGLENGVDCVDNK